MNAVLNTPSPAARLLLVEDERIVALDLKLTLDSLGYQVVATASTQAEAVLLAMAYRPDLILMDINLESGGDGIHAAEEIGRLADLPVVFLTAYADTEILRRAGEVAPYGYLVKPVMQRELHATVQMALARFRASRRHLDSERRLRLALDSARLGVLTLADRSDVIEIDGHFPPLADSPLRGLRMPVADFLARLTDDARARVRQLLAGGGDLHLLTRWTPALATGRPGWLEVHARHMASEQAVVGICRDVTRQVEQEEALRQAAVVFESAADAILILDPQARVITANPAFVRLTGWSNGQIRGLHPNEFLHARRSGDRELLELTPTDRTGHAEVVCVRQDGSSFPAWEHVAPVHDEQGLISHRVLTFSDISALRQAESRVQHLAYHDALTGLGNRNRLREALADLEQGAGPCAAQAQLLFVDLDGFKTINDSLGHELGDKLLVEVSRRIGAALRQHDTAIRLGGDEFVLLVRTENDDDLEALAKRLIDTIRAPLELTPGSSVQVTASIGIACHPQDGDSPDALLRAADIAMYAAKAAGRGRYARYHADMAFQVNERLLIEQGLHQALALGELSLAWQPQMSLDGSEFLGAEALLRWTSPRLGVVAPDRFIPVAEECGLIQPLGRWVLQQALSSWAQWRQQGWVRGRLAVNVSALQLFDERFAEEVALLVAGCGMPTNELEIEITETALQRVPQIEQRLTQLAVQGLRIALDDFGTGYSSLSMLKLLPLQRLKIDRAFVRDIINSGSDQAIVRAIVAMADALGLELIAEGVEGEAQQRWLAEAGVREAQGWLYSRALPEAEFVAWLRTRQAAKDA